MQCYQDAILKNQHQELLSKIAAQATLPQIPPASVPTPPAPVHNKVFSQRRFILWPGITSKAFMPPQVTATTDEQAGTIVSESFKLLP